MVVQSFVSFVSADQTIYDVPRPPMQITFVISSVRAKVSMTKSTSDGATHSPTCRTWILHVRNHCNGELATYRVSGGMRTCLSLTPPNGIVACEMTPVFTPTCLTVSSVSPYPLGALLCSPFRPRAPLRLSKFGRYPWSRSTWKPGVSERRSYRKEEYSPCQSNIRVIRPLDDLVFVAELDNRSHGSKGLFLETCSTFWNIPDHRGFEEVASHSFSACKELGTAFDGIIDVVFNLFEGPAVDQRSVRAVV